MSIEWVQQMAAAYPEDEKSVEARACTSLQSLHSRYLHSSTPTAHIVITHDKIVAKAAKHAAKWNEGTKYEGKVDVKKIVPYTGIAWLNFKNNGCALVKGGDNSHLK